MKLIVGLGNPGKKYKNTRHNIGFMILDQFLEIRNSRYRKTKTYHYAIIGNTFFLKPTTYMNLSGVALREAQRKFHFEEFMVVYDDIYIPFGEIRVREKGSDGGHKGIKSIIQETGVIEFPRIRIGIGAPEYEDLSDYVLTPFSKEEAMVLEDVKGFACRLVEQFIEGNYKQMIDYFSKNNISYSGKIEEISESKAKGGKE